MQSVELKKRHLEESYDSLSDELAKLQAQGEAFLNLQPIHPENMRSQSRQGVESDKHGKKPPNGTLPQTMRPTHMLLSKFLHVAYCT